MVFVGWDLPTVHVLRMRGGLGLCGLGRQLVLTLDRGGGDDAQGKQQDKQCGERAHALYRVDDSADFHRHQIPDPNNTGRLFQNLSLARVMNEVCGWVSVPREVGLEPVADCHAPLSRPNPLCGAALSPEREQPRPHDQSATKRHVQADRFRKDQNADGACEQ